MGMRPRARMRPPGAKAGEMVHVDHQIGAAAIGDRADPGKINDPRIGAAAGDDQLRPVCLGLALDLIVIDPRVVRADAIVHGPKPLAGQVRRSAMRQMPAGGEREAEYRVAGDEEGEENSLVCRGAGMRLYIGETATEEALGAVDRKP